MIANEVNSYIGIPYVKGGQDLNGFDCWGLLRYIQNKHYNVNVAMIDIDSDNLRKVVKEFRRNQEANNWIEIDKPIDGDVLFLSHSNNPSHVGIWIENENFKGVLHSVQGMGVIFSELLNLKTSGWTNIKYYKHISKVTE